MTNVSFSVERIKISLADATANIQFCVVFLLILFEGMNLFIPEQEHKCNHFVHIYYLRYLTLDSRNDSLKQARVVRNQHIPNLKKAGAAPSHVPHGRTNHPPPNDVSRGCIHIPV
jgi:hypothetical protein